MRIVAELSVILITSDGEVLIVIGKGIFTISERRGCLHILSGEVKMHESE